MIVKWFVNALAVLLFGSIPFGLFMAFYMNDANWLLFCLPLLIFLS